jgi:hypothetical protein
MAEAGTQQSFGQLYSHLLSLKHPVKPPGHATDTTLTGQISALRLHPTLEAALHLLNGDLPSAHFLVRQMQAAPAYEGMTLHGILHRMEGDYDNTRAWFRDVKDSEVFAAVWGSNGDGGDAEDGQAAIDKGLAWVDEVEAFSKQRKGNGEELEKKGREEIQRAVEFCKGKFGAQVWSDAREAYAQPGGEQKQLGQDMVTGGKGFRQF